MHTLLSRGLPIVGLALALSGCSATEPAKTPDRIVVDPTTPALTAGGTLQLNARVTNAAGDAFPNSVITYTTSSSIVTVGSTTGLVTSVGPTGSFTITVASSGLSQVVTGQVNAGPGSRMSIVSGNAVPNRVAGTASDSLVVLVTDAFQNPVSGATVNWVVTGGGGSVSAATSVSGANGRAATRLTLGTTAGTNTVVATLGSTTVTFTVTSVAGAVTQVTVSPTQPSIAVGATVTLSATGRDANGNVNSSQAPTWSSSDSSVASVGASTGVVTGLRAGTANVTATIGGASAATAVTVTGSTGTAGTFSGMVYNAVSGAAMPGVTVTVSQGGTTITTATTSSTGTFVTGQLAAGTYSGTVAASGFVTTAITTFRINGNTISEAIPLVPTSNSPGGITGSIINATTNAPLTVPATVELRSGINATSGATVQTITATGSYAFTNVPAGTYTVVARASGFVDASKTGISVGATTTANQNVFISPVSASGTVRAVLTWRDTPEDLDFHLTGPIAGSSSRFHVWYVNEGSCTASPFACLDVDVVSGRGPETLTITQQTSGVYRFSVQNYSAAGDGSSASDATLASSGARVDLYINNALVQTFAVPSGAGSLWTVFELNGSTVTPINTISAGPPPATRIGPTPPLSAARSDAGLIFTGGRAKAKPRRQ